MLLGVYISTSVKNHLVSSSKAQNVHTSKPAMSPMHISRENLASMYKQPYINNIHNHRKQGSITSFYLIYYSGISTNLVGMPAMSLDHHCRKLQGGDAQKLKELQSI